MLALVLVALALAEGPAVLDRTKREALLHRIRQLVLDKSMFAPMYELAFVNGVTARVEESGLGLIAGFAFWRRTRT